MVNQHLCCVVDSCYCSIDFPASGTVNGDVEDQPVDDGSKGELVIGPGAGGMQPRPSEVKRALPPLTYQQEEMLKKAKRYAMEQSVQQVGRHHLELFPHLLLHSFLTFNILSLWRKFTVNST